MRTTRAVIIGALLALGCGDEESQGPPEDVDAGVTAPDVAPQPPPRPIQPTAPVCDEGLSACGMVCLDLSAERDHCGACYNSCGRGSYCDAGECACFAAKMTWCGQETCVDTRSSVAHCGACGNACTGSQYCDEGVCTGDGFQAEVIKLTNQVRSIPQRCGDQQMPAVGPVRYNAELTRAAQLHARDMSERGYFAHNTPDAPPVSADERMRRAGYEGRATGENIARGQRTPEIVVQAWRKSPGHCLNMMNGGFDELGVGYFPGESRGPFWVQNFGRAPRR